MTQQLAQRLFWAWAAAAGLAGFAAGWLWRHGYWHALVDGDPSGISVGIAAMAGIVTLWCGARAWKLQHEALPGSSWRSAYVLERARDAAQAPPLLADRTHGPHETAWWFASAALKLGLLGTVVGFIVMATQLGRAQGFEFSEVQGLLRQMTQGMAIALYTTLAGLIANLWLGLQLLLLDRMADRIAADILAQERA